MANQNATAAYVAKGINEGNSAFATVTVGTLMANTDTITVTAPAGVGTDFRPAFLTCVAYHPTTGVAQAALTVTSHLAGVTVLTAAGAVAVGSKLMMTYVGG